MGLSIAMIGTRGMPATDGGVEMASQALACALVKRGHRVTIYGRRAYCDPNLRWHQGVRQVPLGQINTKHLEAISHTAIATSHAVFRGDYDVIHFHAIGPSLLSWLPRIKAVPTVATIHAMDWKREKWGPIARNVLRAATRMAATAPDETIVVSRVLRALLRDAYGREAHYLPNGVDMSGMTEPKAVDGLGERPFVLFLGRLVPEKQVHVLIQAFAKLDGDFQLAIAGGTSHSDRYMEAIADLAAMDQRVVMLGSRYGAEKAWLLRNAAVFVQPSALEGLPIALLEALAWDRLTVVSDIPENLEAITLPGHKPFGLVFRVGDSDDLASKLASALDLGPTRLSTTPRIGDAILAHYDWERLASETELVYMKALERRGVQLVERAHIAKPTRPC